MDVDAALDALQADVISGRGGREGLAVLGESVGVSPGELVMTLLERAPHKRRWLAAYAARYLPLEEAPEGLLDRLVEATGEASNSFHHRKAALMSLRELEPEAGHRTAVELIRDRANGLEVREMAGEALATFEIETIADTVETLLADDSAATRKVAARVAGDTGCESVQDRLEEMAVHDPDERVRTAAADALRRLPIAAA